MPDRMHVPLGEGLLLIRGEHSFLLIGKAGRRYALRFETFEKEYSETVEPDDLIVVSGPEGGSVEAAGMLLELVRGNHIPLVILPKGHPGSKRLKMVVSVAPEILLACDIQRGTHPEQHLLCSSGELAGMRISGAEGGVEIERMPPCTTVEYWEPGRYSGDKQQYI
ncbi:alpha/beta hydrolase [Methanoculleus taiwanensis]|nr:alpha/beta hydrolase [Methanoculleus taiwanensis]